MLDVVLLSLLEVSSGVRGTGICHVHSVGDEDLFQAAFPFLWPALSLWCKRCVRAWRLSGVARRCRSCWTALWDYVDMLRCIRLFSGLWLLWKVLQRPGTPGCLTVQEVKEFGLEDTVSGISAEQYRQCQRQWGTCWETRCYSLRAKVGKSGS